MKSLLFTLLVAFAISNSYGQVKATSSEINTGTDDDKFATALALQGSKYLDQSGGKLFAIAAGAANVYTASLTPAPTSYTAGQLFYIKITTGNTAAANLNLNGLGAKALVKDSATPLLAGDLLANKVYAVYFDGTNFQVMNTANASASYIANSSILQPSSNFNVSGTGNIGGLLTAGGGIFTGRLEVSGTLGNNIRLKKNGINNNNFIEFLDETGTRSSYIGHGNPNNDLFYTIPTANKHNFRTSNIDRLMVSDGLTDITTDVQMRKSLVLGVASGIVPRSGPILTLGTITGGSGYTDGTYIEVITEVSPAGGVGALVDVTVTNGSVSNVVINHPGIRYSIGDILTFTLSQIGGTGSGASVVVQTVDAADIYASNPTGAIVRLERNATTIGGTAILGGIYFSSRDISSKATGDAAKILARALGTSGGGKLEFYTSANGATNGTLAATIDHLNALTTEGAISTKTAFGIANTDLSLGYGISLYGGPNTSGLPQYGIGVGSTAVFGNHGAVSNNNLATYLTTNASSGRGWIFRGGAQTGTVGNVASISNTGIATFASQKLQSATMNKLQLQQSAATQANYIQFLDETGAQTGYIGKGSTANTNMVVSSNTGNILLVANGTSTSTFSPTGLAVTGTVTATGGNSTNWNTAFAWGNHAGLYSTPVSTQAAITTAEGNLVHKQFDETISGIKYFSTGIGIGTGVSSLQGYKLAVAGGIIAESVKVKLKAAWPDYVFEKDHQLLPLSELEKFIANNKHLPNVPTAAEVKNEGIELGEMNAKLLQKIEELTLYMIEKDKQIQQLSEKLERLNSDVQLIKK